MGAKFPEGELQRQRSSHLSRHRKKRNDITARSNDCTRQNMGSTCDGRSQQSLDIRESIGFLIARSFVGNRRGSSQIQVGEEKANMLGCVCGRGTQTDFGNTDRDLGGAADGGLELGWACWCAGVREHCGHRYGSSRADHGDDRPQARETDYQFDAAAIGRIRGPGSVSGRCQAKSNEQRQDAGLKPGATKADPNSAARPYERCEGAVTVTSERNRMTGCNRVRIVFVHEQIVRCRH